MALNQFPYSDFHEMNLDWIIEKVKELANSFEEFKVLNTITFAGVWDISKNYPMYAIVSDSNGNAYISNKPVPAGISLNNTEYWMKLYEFVSALGALTGRVTTLEGTVSGHTTSINSLTNRMTSAESSITSNSNKIKALIKEDWSARSVLFIGDSYLDGWNGTTSVKTYADYINDYLHFGHYYKASQGGAGFSTPTSSHYLTRVQTWANSQSAATLNGITDIYIMGGYNDINATAEDIIEGSFGINATVSYLKTKMPNAKITLGFIGRALYSDRSFANMTRCINAYIKGSFQAGVNYLEKSELCLHDYTLFGADKIHPSSIGYNMLGNYLTCLILNKGFDYIYTAEAYNVINMNYSTSPFSASPVTFYQGITKNACTIDCYGGSYTFTSPIASWEASYANEILIGDFKNGSRANYFMPKYAVHMNVAVSIQHAGGFDNVEGVIAIKSNGKIVISIQAINNNSWSFKTFTNVSRIAIGKGTVNIPIEYC